MSAADAAESESERSNITDASARSIAGACRICLEDADDAEEGVARALLRLRCACVDAHVHEDCAKRWYGSRGTTLCEICKRDTGLVIETPVAVRVGRGALRLLGYDARGRDEAPGPSAGDVIYIFLFVLVSTWVSMECVMGFPTGMALGMSYAFSLSILFGCVVFCIPLRRTDVPRYESRQFLWAYAISMFLSHWLAFYIGLSRLRTLEARTKSAFSLSVALCVAAVAYPHVVLFGGCLWRALSD